MSIIARSVSIGVRIEVVESTNEMILNVLAVFLVIAEATSNQPYVNIPSLGRVIGSTGTTAWTQRTIDQFYGIRYAESPSRGNRFQPPVEAKPWLHVFDATRASPPCPTFKNLAEVRLIERVRDVEDCLTLSIHTPSLTGRFPVMFYIHGEFFFDGSAEEAQPQYLLEKDIVLVAVQYRLAPFGFLSTRTREVPGNIAAWDVIAALDWVGKNIRYFGGNASEITIFGQGSGASLAHLLVITPLIQVPIFKRVILQSGSMLSPYFITDKPVEHAMDIALQARCGTFNTVEKINECFVRLAPSELIEAFGNHGKSKEQDGLGHYGGFQWSIEDYYGLLPMHPARVIREGHHLAYPMIGGVTKNVGSYLFVRQISKRLQRPDHTKIDIEELVDTILKHSYGDDEFGVWKTLVIENLFESDQVENSTLAALEPGSIDLLTNLLYKGPVLQTLQMNSKCLPNDTFLYTFDYQGQFSRYPDHGSKHYGVSLSDDNLYLFPYPPEFSRLNEEDTAMARLMVDLWTSFATSGVPDSEEIEEWPPVSMVTGPYLSINSEESVKYDFIDEMTRTTQDLQSFE